MKVIVAQIGAQVGAEIRNRLRSPSSLVAFLILLVGSYWAIPPAGGRAVSMSWRLADGTLQSPLYTAGYLGIALSILAGIFFLLAAFYLVSGSVRADRARGIGAILAATPISKASYLGGKFAAHVAYLLLLSLLVLPVGVFHFLRSGEGRFDAASFLLPHLMIAVPAATFIAAAALLFDVVPVLRSRGGLMLWFLFGMMPLIAVPMNLGRDPEHPGRLGPPPAFDPLGLVAQSSLVQDSLPPGVEGVSSGYVFHDVAPERVAWPGIRLTPGLLRGRLLNLLWSLVPFGLAVLAFDRFDPARRRGRRPSPGTEEPAPMVAAGAGPAFLARSLTTLARVEPRPRTVASLVAEVRLLWESAGLYKWLVPIAALVGALVPAGAVPLAAAAFLLLLLPLIAEVGCREPLAGTRSLVFSQPGVPGSVVLWKAGSIALFLLVVSLPLTVRGFMTSALQGAAVPLGMLSIAALAAAGASMSGGGKLFSGVYLLLWYVALNGLAAADACALLAPAPTWSVRAGFFAAGTLALLAAWLVERRGAR